ncbi:alpha-L-rhamnosidase [Beutenbergia cavernae DSM 12333]|uniref:alpha-L-rhamnosidase n=1 Tax=Beutenbergia cavernae (strain ATCC BAA-8 / DSM 12333 / CCUG 43141 / JCM 11478 / NBRC 16432 / NCIMB 13614 / HKI 0122) TaxID=471853 RepID=C5C318_BEUC1|nr:alpha-L-rhamnosidase [Beutenbergia cavernae]ACQ81862.1 alpha-L-rhamnosidase [Beutenbergia cavernae DSM 12333]
MQIDRFVAEYGHPELGTGVAAPRLSWTLTGAGEGTQTAYELEARRPSGASVTHAASSPESVLVPWPFEPLASRERLELRVRAEVGGAWSPWSAPLVVEAGLLDDADWSARFISPRDLGGLDDGAPVLTTDVAPSGEVASARLYVTALGTYTAWIGGTRVGDDVLAPGWTAYQERLRYQTHDVTDLLRGQHGDVPIAVVLGNGWYRGELTWDLRRDRYGDRLALLAQLEITYTDGRVDVVGTDDTWRAGPTGVLADDLYQGQRTDLREPRGAAAAAGASGAVDVLDDDALIGRLVAPLGPPVREVVTLPAREILTSPSGELLVDFGQNLVGWVRLRVRDGAAGSEVTVRHAEVLENGELGVRPLRKARAIDTYVLAGGDEVLEPAYTFHGFRYAEITGARPDLGDLTAVVVSSDLRRTGEFTCSDADVNRLHENVVWGMRGNFVDVPTDCPQRDERLGWTGDIEVFTPAASTLFDVQGFLGSWLADLAADQRPDGGVPFVIPDVLHETEQEPSEGETELPRQRPDAACGWADAATVVPWTLYERYGDTGVLERQYDSMRAWVEKQRALAGPSLLWDTGFQFGDWLDPTAPPDRPADAQADPAVVATAYFHRSADLLARTARVLGRDDDAATYETLAADVAAAFRAAYVSDDGRVHSDCQTVYALAITWDLFATDEQRSGAGDRLAELVREAAFHVSTGFLGTPVILDALCLAGYPDLAHSMLLTRTNPSWLYSVSMGATTIWERWDSMLPDGSINPGEMTSFNHYAYGAVADWLYRSVAGLAPAAPGYREIEVRPLATGQLTHASARVQTPYGEAGVAWRIDGDRFVCDVTVPAGTTATVALPSDGPAEQVGPGHHEFDVRFVPVLGRDAARTPKEGTLLR